MTVKELNLIKRDLWSILMKSPEIEARVKLSGRAIVYDIRDFRAHKIMVVNCDTQINHNSLTENDIDPETAHIERLFTVLDNHNIIF